MGFILYTLKGVLIPVDDVDAANDADQGLDGRHRLAEVHSCKR